MSRQERLQREVRRMSRVREASLNDPNRAIDVVRGGVRIEPSQATSGQQTRASVRIIDLTAR